MKHTISRSISVIILVVIGAIVYSTTLFNTFVWDSVPQIIENPDVHALNLNRIFTSSAAFPGITNPLNYYYKPVMYAVFAVVYFFFQENPLGYHAVQIAVHIANAILLLFVFRKWFKANLSLVLALVFLVHPLNYESVGYISALQDTLFLFFGLIALVLVMYENARYALVRYVAIFSLLLLSLLSKETGILCIGGLILYVWIFGRKGQMRRLLAAAVLATATYAVLRYVSSFDHYGYLTESAIMKTPLLQRIATIPAIFRYYLFTFIAPVRLGIDQQWTVARFSVFDAFVFLVISALVGAIGYVLFGPGKNIRRQKEFLFFSGLFLAGVLLHTHVIMAIDMTVADRWFYFPMIGLLGLVGLGIEKLNLKSTTAIVVAIIVVGLFSVRTFARSMNWTDMETLYEHDLRQQPNNYHLANKYAAELLRHDEIDTAEAILKQAYKDNPRYGALNNNLGYIYEKRGDHASSRIHYQKAVESRDFSERNHAAIVLSRIELFNFNRPERAKQIAADMLNSYPGDRDLLYDLAMAEYALGNRTEALRIAKKLDSDLSSKTVRNLIYAIENNVPVK